jgi:hypothetical protein
MNSQGDWAAVVIVALIGTAIAVYAFIDERLAPRRRAAANRRAIAHAENVANLAELTGVVPVAEPVRAEDHVVCISDDCDLVLCYCSTWEPCEGAHEPGCTHPGAMVCDEHRLSECADCLDDARFDAGVQ